MAQALLTVPGQSLHFQHPKVCVNTIPMMVTSSTRFQRCRQDASVQICHRVYSAGVGVLPTCDLPAVLQIDARQAGHVGHRRQAHVREGRAALVKSEAQGLSTPRHYKACAPRALALWQSGAHHSRLFDWDAWQAPSTGNELMVGREPTWGREFSCFWVYAGFMLWGSLEQRASMRAKKAGTLYPLPFTIGVCDVRVSVLGFRVREQRACRLRAATSRRLVSASRPTSMKVTWRQPSRLSALRG